MLILTVERRRRRLTQAALSRLTGVHPSDISKLESGRVPAYPAWRSAIAKALGMAEGELFREVDDEPPR